MKKIHIEMVGAGYPLVLFHGWGFDSSVWDEITPYLKNRYRLHLIDLPGFGRTQMMSWLEFKDNLKAIMPHQAGFIGWSLGGLYATKFAIEEPKRVSHLINISSSPRFLSEENWPGIEPQTLDVFLAKILQDPMQVMNEFMQLQTGEHYRFEGNLPSIKGLQQGLEILRAWDLRNQIKNIQNPTCYMFGRLDAVTPYRVFKTMVREYPQFDYVSFAKAAHAPFLSHQQEFIEKLEKFIS